MYNTRNVTFRLYEIDFVALEKAAKKAQKTVSDFVRDTVIPQAYKEAGMVREELPKLERGRYGGIVAQAARLAGMTPDELRKQAADNLAQAILSAKGAAGKSKPPKGDSGASGVRESVGRLAAAKKR
jgi:hypothetical protein